MEYNAHDASAPVSRQLTNSELDSVCGGTSQFIAALAATIMNALDPGAHCTAADHKVVCENPPSIK